MKTEEIKTKATTLPLATQPLADDDLPEVIRKVSISMMRLTKAGLTRDAIVVLVKDDTGISKRQIDLVMNSLTGLARKYTRDKP